MDKSLLNSLKVQQDPTDFKISLPDFGIVDFVLYVNPEEFTWTMGEHTRDISENVGGIIESNFQPEFDMLQFTGTTGGLSHDEHGYTHYKREESPAYKSFINFMNIFKNNGDIYNENGIILDSRYVEINFLGSFFRGKFISFSYTEKDDTPLQFDLEFSFKVTSNFNSV